MKLFVECFLFDLTLGISIEPIAIFIINTGINHGKHSALYAGLGEPRQILLFL